MHLVRNNIESPHNGISSADFEQLFMEFYPRLVRFAVRFVEEETAEDMVQNL